ncbi:hypothetical protein VTJ49DRAFT_3047 [Mycothermus thermophilus]|uniref:Transmembrane protein n=1 Tax=Humicola insolens TaxID=85995 RepID=A0ABR3VNU0_HUMIN
MENLPSSPRTPSIRRVPYSYMERLTTTSGPVGNFSPSSWPFPKQNPAKSTSENKSAAGAEDTNEGGFNDDNMTDTGTTQRGPQSTVSGGSDDTITQRRYQAAREGASGARMSVSFSSDSIATEIYLPARGLAVLGESSGEHVKVRRYGELAADIHQRPLTPTPYSTLRKVSEVTEPESEVGCGHEGSREGASSASQHKSSAPVAIVTPRGSSAHVGSREGGSAASSPKSVVLALPPAAVLRDSSRVTSRAHPLSRVSVPSALSAAAVDALTNSSTEAVHGGSEGGAATGELVGSRFSVHVTGMSRIVSGASSFRRAIASFCSARPGTMYEDIELADLRRGPTVRHAPLPASPNAAINACLPVPESTTGLWRGIDRSRKLMEASRVLLLLAVLSFVASITAMSVKAADDKPVTHGLITWALMSGVFLAIFVGFLVLGAWQRRKTTRNAISRETWIEENVRSRPLPPLPRPVTETEHNTNNPDDAGASDEAWHKFATDHEQLRRYVALLETRIAALEDGGSQKATASTHSTSTGGNIPFMSGALPPSTSRVSDPKDKDKKPNYNTPTTSRRQLFPSRPRSDEQSLVGPEICYDSDRGGAGGSMTKSSTKASILTELCEAVTEGYSPLAAAGEPGSASSTNRGSVQILQATSAEVTPSVRPRVVHISRSMPKLPGAKAGEEEE